MKNVDIEESGVTTLLGPGSTLNANISRRDKSTAFERESSSTLEVKIDSFFALESNFSRKERLKLN